MCLLFLYLCKNPRLNSYKLILAANRDEFYERPAKLAHFWEEQPDIIVGGQDMEKGKEGGTWLAMSKTGKIGILLNILSDSISTEKLGRGPIIGNYLNSSLNGISFAEQLEKEADKYNLFNFVTVDLKGGESIESTYYANKGHKGAISLNNESNFYSFGNSLIDTPFVKVSEGKKKFQRLVNDYPFKTDQDKLIEGILSDVLKSTEIYVPDPQIVSQYPQIDSAFMKLYSRRFIEIPKMKYGTRTHTIITVDDKDQVDFIEWTLKEPIKISKPQWIESKFSFSLKRSNL